VCDFSFDGFGSVVTMDLAYPSFGTIVVGGERYDHDVLIEGGRVRPRAKGPSRSERSRYGHTPLTAGEDIPWSQPRLVVGTGASGRLPITPELWDEARTRGVELIAVPTAEACELLQSVADSEVFAVLHVTC
jgi:hypothetical protein